jgi:dienelactone hydrolase
MKTSGSFLSAIVMLLGACACAFAQQASSSQNTDGKIIEQVAYALPAYEELADRFKNAYPKEAVEKMRASADLELLKIKYMSDGLKIVGFIYKPKVTTGKRLPAIIFNRGGLADGAIGTANFNYLWEMHRYASEGFVVLASQYRGTDGSEGKDEAGGADTNDIMSLIPLARSLGYVDMDRLFMWGYSRGAIMTLQAIRRGAPLRAAVVVGAPTDSTTQANNPGFLQFARNVYPDFDARKEEHLKSRSAVLWADKIDIPLLIVQGGADPGVKPTQAMALAQRMEEAGKLYELIIYAKDDHPVSHNAEDRLRKTIDWFRNVRAMSIAQPLGKTLAEQGVEAAVHQYYDLKKTQTDKYDFSERELNLLGYTLLGQGQTRQAIEIFKLNVAVYPQAFNTYDSLGEAYLAGGERELAIQNYRKSLELNPQNTNARDALKKLEQK